MAGEEESLRPSQVGDLRHSEICTTWRAAPLCDLSHNSDMARQFQLVIWLAVMVLAHSAVAETLQGRWKLLAAEDLRANGEVGRLPWGAHPTGSIVVEGGWCYLQIMSSDTPSFEAGQPMGEQMKAKLLSCISRTRGPAPSTRRREA